MGDSSTGSGKLDDSTGVVELKSKITVVVVTSLFLVLFFIFLIHLYVKWFLNRRREEIASANLAAAARRRFEFTPGYQELAALRRGLDPSVLKTIPVVMFTAKDFKDGLECSVCLCQVLQGEKARLLPKCNHGFHVECIDMWFQSHSSCPICRNLVSNLSPESSTTLESNSNSNSIPETTDLQDFTNGERESNNTSSESPPPSFPTNVLFWGNDVEVRTLGNHMEEGQQGANLSQLPVSVPSYSSRSAASNRLNGMLVIDIPQQVNDDQEAKSPAPTRLRSLKRLLSRDTRRVGPSSPRDFDVERN